MGNFADVDEFEVLCGRVAVYIKVLLGRLTFTNAEGSAPLATMIVKNTIVYFSWCSKYLNMD